MAVNISVAGLFICAGWWPACRELSNKQHGIRRVAAYMTMVVVVLRNLDRSAMHLRWGYVIASPRDSHDAHLSGALKPGKRLARPRCSDPHCRSTVAGQETDAGHTM